MPEHQEQAGGELPFGAITEEMIECGIAELSDRRFGDPLRDIVIDVFIAMAAARARA